MKRLGHSNSTQALVALSVTGAFFSYNDAEICAENILESSLLCIDISISIDKKRRSMYNKSCSSMKLLLGGIF